MSIDDPFIPPKKKPSIFWWIGGAFLVVLLIFFIQLFGPSPRIVVSPQTTYITGPLRSNGLPDYEQYLRDLARKGVTPENNAATLLWPMLWSIEPPNAADAGAVAAELGLDDIPMAEDAIVPFSGRAVHTRLSDWLREQNRAAFKENEEAGAPDALDTWLDNSAEQISDQAMSRPWTSEKIPPLAKWMAENHEQLETILEASRRSRCYFPSATLVNRQNDALYTMHLSGQQSVREAGRSLSGRAMWHLGEGRVDDAWQDIFAIHRTAQLTTQGTTLVEQLIAIALSGMACDRTATLLHEGTLSAEQAKQIQRELAALPYFNHMADMIDFSERVMYLDAITGHRALVLSEDQSDAANWVDRISIDWNVACRKGNEFYDRLAAAARLPTYEARKKQFAVIENDIAQLQRRMNGQYMVAAAISPSTRSDAAAAIMLSLFLPAVSACNAAQDRSNTTLDLTRLAAALAVYRAEHGTYPQKLDDLVPNVLKVLPVDLYNAKPFIYKRIDDGYLLYSAGENGQDDAGSNENMNLLDGREIEFDPDADPSTQPQIPSGADDHSIRVPQPPLKLPKTPPAEVSQ